MLDESIAVCNQVADGLGARNPAWETSVVEIVEKFSEVSGTFFFKTMPSIPATRNTLRDANALLETKKSGDWDAFGKQIEALITSAQNVIEKAGMRGTTLT
jgi:hypothetical protein